MMNDLALITTFFNYKNYQSRKNNVNTFLKFIKDSGVSEHLYIAEILYPGQKPFIRHTNTIHLKCESPLWNKECALNILSKKIPTQYTKVMWLDMDIMWFNKNWYSDISKLLDHYKVIQPFSHCVYLNKDFSLDQEGIGYINFTKTNPNVDFETPLHRINYGLALAHRREFYDKLGLFDKFLLGAGDTILTIPITGELDKFNNWGKYFCFMDIWDEAQRYSEKLKDYIDENYGFYNEKIIHLFHGLLKQRPSSEKRKVIGSLNFSDLFYTNSDGLYEIKKSQSEFLKLCHTYFEGRNEDFVQYIKFHNSRPYNVEYIDDKPFMWMSPNFQLSIRDVSKVKFYFSRNNHATEYLNIISQSNKTIDKKIFTDDQLVIELGINDYENITFLGDFFVPSEINKQSTDNRKLSCILNKIEISLDSHTFTDYSLNSLI